MDASAPPPSITIPPSTARSSSDSSAPRSEKENLPHSPDPIVIIDWEISPARKHARNRSRPGFGPCAQTLSSWLSRASQSLAPISAFFAASSARFCRTFTPNKKYPFNLRRRAFFFLLLGLLILLLGLGLGLGIGLSHHFNKSGQLSFPSANGQVQSGEMTYYNPGLGACGITSTESEMIVAISQDVFDRAQAEGANPNLNPLCGRKIRARLVPAGSGTANAEGGLKSAKRGATAVDVTVVDRCVGCKPGDLDMSPAAFERLSELARGRVRVEWVWLT